MMESVAIKNTAVQAKGALEKPRINLDKKVEKSEVGSKGGDNKVAYDPDKKVDTNITEKDDNGKVFKVNGELLPNSEYTINGYEYKTDEEGRIISASGKLKIKTHEGKLKIDGVLPDKKTDDDRGHLIADKFDGSNGIENLVPMNRDLNQKGEYRKLEREWEKALKEGKEVHVQIEPEYDDDTKRPSSFFASYNITDKNGTKYYEKNFKNEASN